MGKNFVETLMGAVVILVAGMFIFISYKSGNITTGDEGYTLTARFHEVGSLNIGSDVRVGGIKVGAVTDQHLDGANYMAVVEMSLKDDVRLPRDSSAAIVSDGFLGGKYVAIEPGGDERVLRDNDEIKYTQDAVSIEALIGKFAFGGVDKDGEGKGGAVKDIDVKDQIK